MCMPDDALVSVSLIFELEGSRRSNSSNTIYLQLQGMASFIYSFIYIILFFFKFLSSEAELTIKF